MTERSSFSLPTLDTCRKDVSNCMNTCKPRSATTLSCEDRCAVSLSGCIAAAGSDPAKLEDCRLQDRSCLIKACRPNADAQAIDRLPLSACQDQCQRGLGICKLGARLDAQQMESCVAAAATCSAIICNSDFTRTTIIPAGQATTVVCESACTQDFNQCVKDAPPESRAACDTSFGDCRTACLSQIGGQAFVGP